MVSVIPPAVRMPRSSKNPFAFFSVSLSTRILSRCVSRYIFETLTFFCMTSKRARSFSRSPISRTS